MVPPAWSERELGSSNIGLLISSGLQGEGAQVPSGSVAHWPAHAYLWGLSLQLEPLCWQGGLHCQRVKAQHLPSQRLSTSVWWAGEVPDPLTFSLMSRLPKGIIFSLPTVVVYLTALLKLESPHSLTFPHPLAVSWGSSADQLLVLQSLSQSLLLGNSSITQGNKGVAVKMQGWYFFLWEPWQHLQNQTISWGTAPFQAELKLWTKLECRPPAHWMGSAKNYYCLCLGWC